MGPSVWGPWGLWWGLRLAWSRQPEFPCPLQLCHLQSVPLVLGGSRCLTPWNLQSGVEGLRSRPFTLWSLQSPGLVRGSRETDEGSVGTETVTPGATLCHRRGIPLGLWDPKGPWVS